MKNVILIVVIFTLLTLAGCAEANTYVSTDHYTPGFFDGFFNGLLLPFNFIASLFIDEVGIYTVINNGHMYDFGFVLGVLLDIGALHD